MQLIRTFLLPLILLFIEAALTVGLFFFATRYKLYYVIFALLLLIGTLVYLGLTRYRESLNIRPRGEILGKYKTVVLRILAFAGGGFVFVVLIRALAMVLFR